MLLPKWRWSMILLLCFLLRQYSCQSTITTELPPEPSTTTESVSERPYSTYTSHNVDKPDQVNAAETQYQNGYTTRILATGELDDEFWLKHLGEDFKQAIHLHVDESDNIYRAHPNGKKQSTKPTETGPVEKGIEAVQKVDQNAQEYTTESQDSRPLNTAYNIKNDDMGLSNDLISKLVEKNNEQKIAKQSNADYISLNAYASTHVSDDFKNKKMMHWFSRSNYDPVVIHLPESRKVIHQIDDTEEPMVVKMPPVIYHGDPETINSQEYTHQNLKHNFNYPEKPQLPIVPNFNSHHQHFLPHHHKIQPQYHRATRYIEESTDDNQKHKKSKISKVHKTIAHNIIASTTPKIHNSLKYKESEENTDSKTLPKLEKKSSKHTHRELQEDLEIERPRTRFVIRTKGSKHKKHHNHLKNNRNSHNLPFEEAPSTSSSSEDYPHETDRSTPEEELYDQGLT